MVARRALVERLAAVAPVLQPQAAALGLWAGAVLGLDQTERPLASERSKQARTSKQVTGGIRGRASREEMPHIAALWPALADRVCDAAPERAQASAVGLTALAAATLRLAHPRLLGWILSAANLHQRHLAQSDLARL